METIFIVALSVAFAFALVGLIIGHNKGDQGDLIYMFGKDAGARIAGAILGLIAGFILGFVFGLLTYGVPLVAGGIVIVVAIIVVLELRRNKADWDDYNRQHGIARK